MISSELKTVFVDCAQGMTEAERGRIEGVVEAKLPEGWRCVALPGGSQLSRVEANPSPVTRHGYPYSLANFEVKLEEEASEMPHIRVHRYEQVKDGHVGYVAPDDGKWILFVHKDGTPWFCPDLAPDGSALHDGFKPATASREDDLVALIKQCFRWPSPAPGETQTAADARRRTFLLAEIGRRIDEASAGAAVCPIARSLLEALREAVGKRHDMDILRGDEWATRVQQATAIRFTMAAHGRADRDGKVEALVGGAWMGVEVQSICAGAVAGEPDLHGSVWAILRIDDREIAIGRVAPAMRRALVLMPGHGWGSSSS